MTKRRYPSEINTRVARINIEDYRVLIEMAQKSGKTVAESLHSIIQNQEKKMGDRDDKR